MEPGAGAGAGAGGKEAASRPLTAEEEAVKRNTDCVYFLASPLTCKKGNDCEYRHSEGARVNPRDCWYWLNGNCLNPKCSFRHPPLEGLFGNPGTTPLPAPLPSQTVSAAQVPALHGPASYNPSKPSVNCYFFQKGQCLKGDRCPYMHGPQPAGTPVQQQVAKVFASVTESPHTLKEPWCLKECTTQQNIPIPRASVEKPVVVLPSSAKPASKIESVHNNGLAHKRSISPYPLESELPRSQTTNVPVSSGNATSLSRTHQSEPVDEHPQNGRDADEFLGESSPGFDVLVDDDIKDSDYLHNEDDFGRESGQDGRNLYPGTDFNYHHSEYEPVPSFERERYNGMDEYDRYGRIHSSHGREQQRTSSERIMDRHLMPERRVQHREGSLEKMDGSDLRHRLLKQRRLNISRSAISPDHRGEPYRRDDRYSEEDRYRGRHSHRDRRHFPPESSLSTRLKGRIKLPVRSSPDRPVDYLSEKETDRGRHRGRFSPARPTDYHGKHHDKMKQRSQEDFATAARNLRGQPMRKDEADPLNFVGPKSLAELKGVKISGDSQEQSTKSINDRFSPDQRSMKSGKAVDCQESEGSHSFEATKPLNSILKRKRETSPEIGAMSSSNGENTHGDGEVVLGSSTSATDSNLQSIRSSEAVKEVNRTTRSMQVSKVEAVEAVEEEEEEGLISEAGEDDQSPAKDTVEMEKGLIVDTAEDRDAENSEQRTEESDYEAVEGEEKAENDDHIYQDDEEMDDDDDDDFARKIGVMYS